MIEKTVSSVKVAGKTGKVADNYMYKVKLEHLTPYTKINSKWIKDLNVRPDTIKLLEKNVGRTPFDINHSNIFFTLSPRIMEIKTKINK